MDRFKRSLGALFVLLLAACQGPPGQAVNDEPDLSMMQGGNGQPSDCPPCSEGQVCMGGSCVALPKQCPCPLESYCNLATNMCVAGCTEDGHCAPGRICNEATRQCRTGCRKDTDCGSGKICDNLQCRTGCRKDTDCGPNEVCETPQLVCKAGCTSDTQCAMGQICEQLRCRAGCRNDTGCAMGQICEMQRCRTGCRKDTDCGPNAVCRTSTLSCMPCDNDPDEATDTQVSTSGRNVSQRVTRVLCGTMDVDRVTWIQGPPNPGYYRLSSGVTLSGASMGAITTIRLGISGTTQTFELAGNGYHPLRQDTFDFYCFNGQCAGWTHTLVAQTNSETPVKLEFSFSVSATR
ncbi:MAG: hypothetical protein RMK29_11165 [Myxococcales bacterium]|nr:hypothetical protein [Myxococcota bacterium]MDW8282266.1 hypothetical protein [Myxococcales bacterium]